MSSVSSLPLPIQKKKILMLYDFPIAGGGSGAYVKYLSLRLNEIRKGEKYEVAIAAPDREKTDRRIKQFNLKLPQIPVFIGRPGLERSKKYSELTEKEMSDLYIGFLKETVKIVEKWKPDIIHVHHMLINAWVADFIRSVYGIPYIVTSHGSCLHAISQDKRYLRQTRDSLKAASWITVVSGDTREKLLKMFGSDLTRKTRTIPGGIRLDLFPEVMEQEELDKLRKKLSIKSNKIVLFTGRLITEKGVEYLVKAASRINGDVIIAGDGPQKKKLEALVKELNLQNVHLLGHFDYLTLIKLYYLADVFISPAVWDEPLGLTIIEAMAASKPVVVTRKGGVTMAVKNGVNGYFVRPRNSTDIVEKVNKLFADPVLAQKMGQKARQVVENRFTWRKIARRFNKVYSRI